MPTEPEAFSEPLCASGQQPCALTHLIKGLVPHSSGWWDGRQIPLLLRETKRFKAHQVILVKNQFHFSQNDNTIFPLYHEGFSDYCLHLKSYFHNVSANMSSGFLQVFVELGNLHGTSNYVLYWIHGVASSDSVSHNRVQVLSIPVLLLVSSQDWTCNLQMIVSLEA